MVSALNLPARPRHNERFGVGIILQFQPNERDVTKSYHLRDTFLFPLSRLDREIRELREREDAVARSEEGMYGAGTIVVYLHHPGLPVFLRPQTVLFGEELAAAPPTMFWKEQLRQALELGLKIEYE